MCLVVCLIVWYIQALQGIPDPYPESQVSQNKGVVSKLFLVVLKNHFTFLNPPRSHEQRHTQATDQGLCKFLEKQKFNPIEAQGACFASESEECQEKVEHFQ